MNGYDEFFNKFEPITQYNPGVTTYYPNGTVQSYEDADVLMSLFVYNEGEDEPLAYLETDKKTGKKVLQIFERTPALNGGENLNVRNTESFKDLFGDLKFEDVNQARHEVSDDSKDNWRQMNNVEVEIVSDDGNGNLIPADITLLTKYNLVFQKILDLF